MFVGDQVASASAWLIHRHQHSVDLVLVAGLPRYAAVVFWVIKTDQGIIGVTSDQHYSRIGSRRASWPYNLPTDLASSFFVVSTMSSVGSSSRRPAIK